jgi:hypothetical protein
MPPGVGHALVRVAAVVPVVLIVLFIGLLWLLGLVCRSAGRLYVLELSHHAVRAIETLTRWPATPPPSARRKAVTGPAGPPPGRG